MPEATHRGGERASQSAGHVAVHVEGAHPPDIPFLFERQPSRQRGAFAASFLINSGLILLAVVGYRSGVVSEMLPDNSPLSEIVWLAEPGPGGGGGGGGNEMKEPPRKAELPGKDEITVPVQKPPDVQIPKEPKPEPDPVEQLTIPAATLASAADSLPGLIDVPAIPTLSQGSGTRGGAGTGSGTGIGPGTDSGLGPGSGGGFGGGAYRPGSGVSNPIKIREVRPQYTSEAMRAKVQGSVLLRCVVRTDGTVGDVEVLRSLDGTFGLDEEAIKAARQWLFRPGTLKGQPVPVEITIELTFTLR